MRRTPEPELMDEPGQARAYAEADFAVPHQFFVDEFARVFPGEQPAGTVVDLGCGPADVTVRFARAYPDCRLLGIDGAPAMLEHARQRLRREGLEDRIALLQAHLPAPLSVPEAVDSVISNSLLHHLGQADTLWAAVRALGRPGCRVFVMDLMRPDSPERAEALLRTYAASEPEVLQRDFLASLHAAYRPEEVRAQLREAGLHGLRVDTVSDRHWVAWGRLQA